MQPIRLFLSSPGDVGDERERVASVVNQLNRMLGDRLDCRLEVIDWRTHVTPDMGRPQDIINKQISPYDIFVGIMWKRFGTPTGKADSGTEEEFNIAYKNWQSFKRPRILFYFNQKPYMPKGSDEMQQFAKVIAFKETLQSEKGLVCEYGSLEEFRERVTDHLSDIMKEWFTDNSQDIQSGDFSKYLHFLKNDCTYIDIRGLVSGEGRVYQFRIDELYIPLKISSRSPFGRAVDKAGNKKAELFETKETDLSAALEEKRLIIRGEPGAGKSTFLQLLTFTLCSRWRGETTRAAVEFDWPEQPPLPIFVRMGDLTQFLRRQRQNGNVALPTRDDSPECLLRYLEARSQEYAWHLSADDFRRELEAGRCLILLDGLDEAPDEDVRKQMSDLADNILKAYPGNQLVLTSRPAALTAEVMPAGFSLVDILPLDDAAMTSFLNHWCQALYPETPEKAQQYQNALIVALTAKPEIRRMARTPVMLTALAVVHWNQHQLPEQRFELYESILTWLFRARKHRPGRLKADTCRMLLQKLALAMFTHPQGRQRIVDLAWAAETVAALMKTPDKRSAQKEAEYFLRDEMIDSGIIVRRNNALEFWHLSFQEYLAAYEIAGLVEDDQEKLLFKKERIFSPEWHETILLLAGVLHKQGVNKVNQLVDLILHHTPQENNADLLPQQARSVALLGGIQNDLSTLDYKPGNKAYDAVIHRVEGIFDVKTFRAVPAAIRSQAADALALAGDPRFDTIEWIDIPGGEFYMGAQKTNEAGQNFDPDAYNIEEPVHAVKLSAFQMSKYPITVAQYKKFIEADGYKNKEFWKAGDFAEREAPDEWDEQLLHPGRPVVYVRWYEASAFAAWIGGRLPSEAEWEYAARGAAYRKWPWDDTTPDAERCNLRDTNLSAPSPVGVFPENVSPFGLVDMAGNVWEWCRDWYSEDYYKQCLKQGTVDNPPGPKKGDWRVLRGGSYYDDAQLVRCALRISGTLENGGFNYSLDC